MKFFSQRAELKRQLAETKAKKLRYEVSLQRTKEKVHNRATSPITLASSFAAGAIVGFFATRKSKEKKYFAEDSNQSSTKSVATKRSLTSKFGKDLVGIGLSLVLAEVTKQMKQKIDQASRQEIAGPQTNRENLASTKDEDYNSGP